MQCSVTFINIKDGIYEVINLLPRISASRVSIDLFSINAGSRNFAGSFVCRLLVDARFSILSVSTVVSSLRSSILLSVAIDSIEELTSSIEDVLIRLSMISFSNSFVDNWRIGNRSSWMIRRVVLCFVED